MSSSANKQVFIRFYWVHDYDLVGLTVCKGFSLSECAKNALVAYANHDREFFIHVPEDAVMAMHTQDYLYRECDDRRKTKNPSKKRKQFNMHFLLNPEKPDELAAILLLDNLAPGTRNSAVKNMIRMYLDRPNFFPYIRNPEYEFSIARRISGDFRGIISDNPGTSSVVPDVNPVASDIQEIPHEPQNAISDSFDVSKDNSSPESRNDVSDANSGVTEETDAGDVFDIFDQQGW